LEKVVGEQGLALQQHFPYKSSSRINSFFDARDLRLGRFGIFDALFPFLAFLKL